MFKRFLAFRYIFVVAVIFMLINSLFFMIIGIMECVEGYSNLIKYGITEESRPGLHLLRGLELFLVSMVSLILGLVILNLFTNNEQDVTKLPSWLKIDNFKELKVLLWETILVTLVVFTLSGIVSSQIVLNWNALILPAAILLLSASLFLMKK